MRSPASKFFIVICLSGAAGAQEPQIKARVPPVSAPAPVSALTSVSAHRPEALGAVFSLDGKWLITTGADRTAAVRDPKSAVVVRTLRGHANRVYRAAVSADSQKVATSSGDGSLRVWSIESGEQLATFNVGTDKLTAVRAVAISPRGDLLAGGADDGTIRIWNLVDGKELASFEQQSLPITSLAFSPDGALLASATGDWRNYQEPGDVRLWEVATGKQLVSLPGYSSEIKCLAIDPAGKYLATSTSSRLLQLWNLTTREELAKARPASAGTSLAFSPDGARLAVGEHSGGVSTWSVPALKLATLYAGHLKTVSGIAFSPDGERLATAGHDATVSLWRVGDGEIPTNK